MNRIVFLVSSNGGTLKFINEYCKLYPISELEIINVIADRSCGALDYAKKNNIPSQIVKYNKENRQSLREVLAELNPDYIITNTFKILDANLVNNFKGKLINFHYSLLPAFKGFIGVDTIREARKINCQFIGSTCHLVDEQVDNGLIIGQLNFQIKPSITDEVYISTMFRANCIQALNILLSLPSQLTYEESSITILKNSVYFSPSIREDFILPNEEFWSLIQSL